MTDGIVEFIEAQLAEDQATAEAWDEAERRWQQVGQRNLRYDNGLGEHVQSIDVGGDPMLWSESIWVKHDLDGKRTAHIARHDPARILAEVEAKRAILAEHKHVPATEPSTHDFGCQICAYDRGDYVQYGWGWCKTVLLLAAPYAGRPGFKDEWRLS